MADALLPASTTHVGCRFAGSAIFRHNGFLFYYVGNALVNGDDGIVMWVHYKEVAGISTRFVNSRLAVTLWSPNMVLSMHTTE